jgi:DNA (cytosine-5)-methyltransferase 1
MTMVNNKTKIGSLFSGIGGLELGLEWSGVGETIWQVEKNEYCVNILSKHWPNVERYKDVKTVGAHNLKYADIICGGFPCQDVSTAGKGVGLSGTRSGLWFEFLRIIKELCPEWVVIENVAGGAKKWVDNVRLSLGRQGYASIPIPLSAKDCGAHHIRKRVFIVAHAHSKHLREQSRRCKGPSREDTVQLGSNGERGSLAHSDSNRELQSKRSIKEQRGRTCYKGKEFSNTYRKLEKWSTKPWGECNYWAIEPDVGRLANGIPNRVDRLKALGNAVVPQCAQVIGEFMKQLYIENEECDHGK